MIVENISVDACFYGGGTSRQRIGMSKLFILRATNILRGGEDVFFASYQYLEEEEEVALTM